LLRRATRCRAAGFLRGPIAFLKQGAAAIVSGHRDRSYGENRRSTRSIAPPRTTALAGTEPYRAYEMMHIVRETLVCDLLLLMHHNGAYVRRQRRVGWQARGLCKHREANHVALQRRCKLLRHVVVLAFAFALFQQFHPAWPDNG